MSRFIKVQIRWDESEEWEVEPRYSWKDGLLDINWITSIVQSESDHVRVYMEDGGYWSIKDTVDGIESKISATTTDGGRL